MSGYPYAAQGEIKKLRAELEARAIASTMIGTRYEQLLKEVADAGRRNRNILAVLDQVMAIATEHCDHWGLAKLQKVAVPR